MLGAEEPSLIRGGARLGGRGGPLENFVGDVTKYVVSKADCRVIVTAPAAARPSAQAPATDARRDRGRRSHRLISRSLMFVLIVGAGRVGSAVAKSALAAGHEVSVLDEDPLSHERLDAGQSKSLGGRRRPVHGWHGARDGRPDPGRASSAPTCSSPRPPATTPT